MAPLTDEPYPDDRYELMLPCGCDCDCVGMSEDGGLCTACLHGYHTIDE
jgi:hypothetical protein